METTLLVQYFISVSKVRFTHVTGCAPGWKEGEIVGVKKCFKFGGGGTSLDGMEKCCQQGGYMPSPKMGFHISLFTRHK